MREVVSKSGCKKLVAIGPAVCRHFLLQFSQSKKLTCICITMGAPLLILPQDIFHPNFLFTQTFTISIFLLSLIFFWLGVKADTAVLSILAHFPPFVYVSSSPELSRCLPGKVPFSRTALFTLGQTYY